MKTTCLIVDDEPLARKLIASHVTQIDSLEVVGEFGLAVDAANFLRRQKVDLLFLDIQMPGITGLQLAETLRNPPAIILTTAYRNFAPEAFELEVVDYLLKPVRAQRLLAALRKVRERAPLSPAQIEPAQQAARSHLSCVERGRLLLIPVAEIIYLKAELKYVTARTRSREYLLDESLTQLEHEFGEQFIRLHRSVLATREAIVGFEKCGSDDADAQWQAMLRDVPDRLPVSRRQWPLVRTFARQVLP